MGCGCGKTPCTDKPACTCAVKDLSTDCVLYTGEDLACSGITSGTLLTVVIESLDAFICNKFEEAIKYLTLVNIGGGAEVYKGISGIGNKEIRTLMSGNEDLIDVEQDTDTINITPGIPSMTHIDDILRFIVTTVGGATEFASIDLSEYNYDTFVQSASFDSGTLDLTIVRNNGEPDIVVPLDFLNNHVESGTYASNTITLTLTDTTEVDIDVATLVSEILAAAAAAQVNANFLESNPASKAFIQNKNPTKTVTIGVGGNYNVVDTDNNYVIEIDNGANNVTISFASVTATDNFFVGFVQKGTGAVTFSGYDIIQSGFTPVIYGQGHISALEIINSTKYLHGTLIKTP